MNATQMNEAATSAINQPPLLADRPTLSVVIPVYNEEAGLAALFERL